MVQLNSTSTTKRSPILAGIENVADVVEQAGTRLAGPLIRHRKYKLYLTRNQHVATIRPAKTVAWAEVGLFESAYRLGSTAVELLVRRRRRSLAHRLTDTELRVDA